MREIDKQLIQKYCGILWMFTEDEDWERAHSNADGALCDLLKELGYYEVVEVYHKVGKWYA